MTTKNNIHAFYDELKIGDDGYRKKKQCKLCATKIDESNIDIGSDKI